MSEQDNKPSYNIDDFLEAANAIHNLMKQYQNMLKDYNEREKVLNYKLQMLSKAWGFTCSKCGHKHTPT